MPQPRRLRAIPTAAAAPDRKSTRLNSSHSQISYAVFCLKKKKASLAMPSYASLVALGRDALPHWPLPVWSLKSASVVTDLRGTWIDTIPYPRADAHDLR